MAANTRAAQSSYFAVAFRAKPKIVRAFLHGLTLGAGLDATLFFHFDEGIHDEGRVERLAEKFGLRASDCHVVVDGNTSALLRKLRKRLAEDAGLEIVSHRKVKSATMAFRYRAFTPRHDQEIRDALDDLPAGVRLRDFDHATKSDPKSHGMEAYAPSHEFESQGSGVVSGPVDRLIELRRRAADYPLLEVEEIRLVYA